MVIYSLIKCISITLKLIQGWTTKGIFVEKIDRDLIHWSKISINLEVFFKSYVVKALLAIQPLTFSGKCSKILVEEKEMNENEHHLNDICCDRSATDFFDAIFINYYLGNIYGQHV